MIRMAVILAGGKALRLQPLTSNLPKSMLEINGKPFIYHQLMMLKNQGIETIIICAGFKGNMLRSECQILVRRRHSAGDRRRVAKSVSAA